MNLTAVLIFMAVGFFLVLLETVVPGGVSGFLGMVFLLCGLTGVFFCYGFETGCAAALVLLAAGIAGVWAWFRFLPKTRIGSGLLVGENSKGYVSYSENNPGLCGRTGRTLTKLRPVGRALIDGGKYDVVTSGEPLGAGCAVRVIQVEGNRIVVEEITDAEDAGTISQNF